MGSAAGVKDSTGPGLDQYAVWRDGSVAVAVSYGAVEQARQQIRVCVSCLVVKTWRREWLINCIMSGSPVVESRSVRRLV